MKRTGALITAFALALTLTACSNEPQRDLAQSEPQSQATDSVTETEDSTDYRGPSPEDKTNEFFASQGRPVAILRDSVPLTFTQNYADGDCIIADSKTVEGVVLSPEGTKVGIVKSIPKGHWDEQTQTCSIGVLGTGDPGVRTMDIYTIEVTLPSGETVSGSSSTPVVDIPIP